MQGVSSRYPPGPTPGVREPLRFRQITLAVPQGFGRPLAVLDIDVVSVPAENVSGAVTKGAGAAQEPAVFSVEAPDAYLCLEGFSLRHCDSPFVAQLFNVVGMDAALSQFAATYRLSVYSRVFQPALTNKVQATIRSRSPDECRHSIDNQSNPVFRFLRCGDVHHRSNKVEAARFIAQGMSDNTDIFYGTIRHQQAMFKIKIAPILQSTLNCLLRGSRVFRMNPLDDKFDGRYRRLVILEDSKGFLGPEDLAGGGPPAEAPRMTEPLGLFQVRLPSLLGTLTSDENAVCILQ